MRRTLSRLRRSLDDPEPDEDERARKSAVIKERMERENLAKPPGPF